MKHMKLCDRQRLGFLDVLGIVRIPADQVTLHPFLLGQKYQRAADRAILKKSGVIT